MSLPEDPSPTSGPQAPAPPRPPLPDPTAAGRMGLYLFLAALAIFFTAGLVVFVISRVSRPNDGVEAIGVPRPCGCRPCFCCCRGWPWRAVLNTRGEPGWRRWGAGCGSVWRWPRCSLSSKRWVWPTCCTRISCRRRPEPSSAWTDWPSRPHSRRPRAGWHGAAHDVVGARLCGGPQPAAPAVRAQRGDLLAFPRRGVARHAVALFPFGMSSKPPLRELARRRAADLPPAVPSTGRRAPSARGRPDSGARGRAGSRPG